MLGFNKVAASKLNYIVVYKNHSQVYGSGTKKVATATPLPDGVAAEDKNIYFITFEPDSGNICLSKVEEESD
jgi:hypothetical protein